MISTPHTKYAAFPPVQLADRQWPSRTITTPPVWMSTDLRDGNQALFEPMNADKKMQMFKMLCAIGFKEIEVAFPSASETEFGFVRSPSRAATFPTTFPSKSSPRPASTSSAAPSNRSRAPKRPSCTSITPPARPSATPCST